MQYALKQTAVWFLTSCSVGINFSYTMETITFIVVLYRMAGTNYGF